MSANVKEFLEKVNADDGNSAAYKEAKDLGEVSELAGKLGYEISPAELQDYFKSQSISDSDLDNISGGVSMMGAGTEPHGGWYSGD